MWKGPTHQPLQRINDYRPEKKLNSQPIHQLTGFWVTGFSNDILYQILKVDLVDCLLFKFSDRGWE